jgi:hypothetical protein
VGSKLPPPQTPIFKDESKRNTFSEKTKMKRGNVTSKSALKELLKIVFQTHGK